MAQTPTAKQLNRFSVNTSADAETEEFVVELVLDPDTSSDGNIQSAQQLESEGARFARFVFENLGGLNFAAGFHREFARLLENHPEQVESVAA